jgi:periplasmic protein TonB
MMRRALLVSLLLHLVVLLAGRPQYICLPELVATRSGLLAASLVPAKSAMPTDPSAPIAKAKVVNQPLMKRKAAHLAASTPSVKTVQETHARLAPASVAAEPPVAVGSGASGPGPKNGVSSALSDVVNVDALRQYRLALAREARRYKRYPEIAKERGWEGEVAVLVAILPGGGQPQVALGKSSGHEALDAQALEMVVQAVRLAPLPDGLAGGAFRISVPVRYSLED